jgi:hypothetical protein
MRALIAFALASAGSAQDLFLGQQAPSQPKPPAHCGPKEWHLGVFGSGYWILDHTEDNWAAYMKFLNVSADAWDDEFNSSDIHQYIFDLEKNEFVMNHTIPASGFSLLFNASLSNEWEENPYPAPTPAGFDPNISTNFSTWRNKIDKGPGSWPYKVDGDSPDGNSCWSLKTHMPQPRNETQPDGSIKTVMYYNTFWRELVSPILARYTLMLADENFEPIEPWKSQGYSYRWFRRTVQTMDDVVKRLPCKESGYEGELFC